MATSLCGTVGAGRGCSKPRVRTYYALLLLLLLLLLPAPPNLGYQEDETFQVCGEPWWSEDQEETRHWPWEASVRVENEHVCGGALIHSRWVVSAAHCIQSNSEYSVVVGTTRLEPQSSRWTMWIPVKDIILHPKYWGRTFITGDVALLHLQNPATFSKYVQPVCLPEPNFNLKVGTQCWVTGWGQAKQYLSGRSRTNSTLLPELKEAEVFVMDNRQCDQMYHRKSLYPRIVPIIQRNMICATNYGENLCYGDSGGPLACQVGDRWILAGVLSWEKDCSKPENPGVYTRLTKYSHWIKEQVGRGVLSQPCSSSWLLFTSWLLRLWMSP